MQMEWMLLRIPLKDWDEGDAAADKIKGIGDETEKAKTKVLSATEEMGARFQESMGSSLKSGESFWKSFKSGIGSSFGYAGERAKAFLMTVTRS